MAKKKMRRSKGITRTVIEPKWMRKVRGAKKAVERTTGMLRDVAMRTLAVVGLVTVVIVIARSL